MFSLTTVLLTFTYGVCCALAGYVLPSHCPPINRMRLFKDSVIWLACAIPSFMFAFLICRICYRKLSNPQPFRRRHDDLGEVAETAESYTELEAVDAVDPKLEAKSEVEKARLRVHPSSRRKHHIAQDLHENQQMDSAQTTRLGAEKKRSRRRTTKSTKANSDQTQTAAKPEDITQRSIVDLVMGESKTQSLSPESSVYFRPSASSVTNADSMVRPTAAMTPPGRLEDAIPADEGDHSKSAMPTQHGGVHPASMQSSPNTQHLAFLMPPSMFASAHPTTYSHVVDTTYQSHEADRSAAHHSQAGVYQTGGTGHYQHYPSTGGLHHHPCQHHYISSANSQHPQQKGGFFHGSTAAIGSSHYPHHPPPVNTTTQQQQRQTMSQQPHHQQHQSRAHHYANTISTDTNEAGGQSTDPYMQPTAATNRTAGATNANANAQQQNQQPHPPTGRWRRPPLSQ